MSQSKSHYKNESSFTIFFLTLFQIITGSVEVFIRLQMGERYMTILRAVWMLFFFAFFAAIMNEFVIAFNTNTMGLFFFASFVLAIIHAINAKKRHSKNVEIHSYYNGVPIIGLFLSNDIKESTIKSIIEPTILFLLGVVLFVVGRYMIYEFYGIGFYLTCVGIIMFIKGQIEYNLERNRYLDAFDKKIESEVLKGALEGKDAADNKGFSLPGPKSTDLENRKSVENMYRSLSPELQKLMTKEPKEDVHRNMEPNLEIENIPQVERINSLEKPPKPVTIIPSNKDIDRDM